MIMPSTLALVNAYHKDADRLRALSFWPISSWGGGGLCNIFGGAVATCLGWRYTVWLVIPVALIALWAMAATPESKNENGPRDQRFDLIALVLPVVGLLTLNLSITKGRVMGWTDMLIIGGFVVSYVTLLAFTLYERSRKAPLVHLSILNRRSYATGAGEGEVDHRRAGRMLWRELRNPRRRSGRGAGERSRADHLRRRGGEGPPRRRPGHHQGPNFAGSTRGSLSARGRARIRSGTTKKHKARSLYAIGLCAFVWLRGQDLNVVWHPYCAFLG